MRTEKLLFPLAFWAALFLLAGAATAAPKNPKFKTTNVTLYDCGLAQIEKQAVVHGAQTLEIDVTLAHLDDLLASLVLATDDSVRVKGVNYPMVRNLGQAIASSGMANALSSDTDMDALTMPAGVPGYMKALVGMNVTIERKGKRSITGTVLACVDETGHGPARRVEKINGDVVEEAPMSNLVMVTGDGAMSWVPVDEISVISPVSGREATAMSDFAVALGKANGFTETVIELTTSAGSKGKLAAAYIRQMPLWKTVYKVTADDDNVTLEVWAVVHNDTSEDWNDVEMTLVSGLPKSYVFSVASPRYAERETLFPEEEGGMMPQLGARTPDSLLYDFEGLLIGESFGYGGLGMYGTGTGGGGSGAGMVGARGRGVVGHGGQVASSERTSSLLDVGEPAAEEQMEAAVEGEISTYKAMNKVSIPAGTSSLVPVVRKKLDGGSFTLLESGSNPATCVRVVNGTGLVLQDGMASFYISGRFRGQTDLWRTEPGDISVWCFGEDPDVTFDRDVEVEHVREMLEWKGGQLWSHNLKHTTYQYTVENKAGQPRKIALDVRHIENGRVVSPKTVLDTDMDNRKLYIFEIAGRVEEVKKILVEEGVMRNVPIEIDKLWELSRIKSIPKKQRDVLLTARNFLVKEVQLRKQREKDRKLAAEKDADVLDCRATLAVIPSIKGRSKSVEKILTKLVAAQNKAVDYKESVRTLGLRIEKAHKHAIDSLKTLIRKPGL